MGSLTVKRSKKALLDLKGLIEAGKVRPVIDSAYPLHEAAEAMRYLEEGHARGKVVISVWGARRQRAEAGAINSSRGFPQDFLCHTAVFSKDDSEPYFIGEWCQ